MPTYTKNPDNLGALWIAKDDDGKVRKDKNGNSFMNGNLEIDGVKIPVVLFKNSFKKEDKQPDYKIMKKTAQEGGASRKPQDDTPF